MNRIQIYRISEEICSSAYIILLGNEEQIMRWEKAAACLYEFFSAKKPQLLLFEDSDAAHEVAARLACQMKGTALMGADRLWTVDKEYYAEKKCFSENISCAFRLGTPPLMVSCAEQFALRIGNCARKFSDLLQSASAEELLWKQDHLQLLSYEKRPVLEDLTQAKKVVIGGRGAATPEGKEIISELAKASSAKVGASRAAVMDGYWGFDRLVGASGKRLHADIAVTIGVSGASPFVTGLTGCKGIVSVNSDPKALIFRSSDYGIVSDYRSVIKHILKEENGCDKKESE